MIKGPTKELLMRCPKCDHNLASNDHESLVWCMGGPVYCYACVTCGHASRWLFDALVPIRLKDAE